MTQVSQVEKTQLIESKARRLAVVAVLMLVVSATSACSKEVSTTRLPSTPPSSPTAALTSTAEITVAKTAEITPTSEVEYSKSTLVLDFFDSDISKEPLSRLFPVGFSRQSLLNNLQVPSNHKETGVKELQLALPSGNPEFDKQLLQLFLIDQYSQHGEIVNRSLQMAHKLITGKETDGVSVKISVAKALVPQDVTYDELGNPSLIGYLDSDIAKSIIEKTDNKVINLSLEFGSNTIKYDVFHRNNEPRPPSISTLENDKGEEIPLNYYDSDNKEITREEYDVLLAKYNEESKKIVAYSPTGREITKIDGYFGPKTESNLNELLKLVRSFPDRIFVAVGGNPYSTSTIPDILALRENLVSKNMWPNNLVMVGFEYDVMGFKGPASIGSDIYVPTNLLDSFKLPPASSFSTPIISEILQELREKNPNEDTEGLVSILNTLTDEKKSSVGDGNRKITYRVLNTDKVKKYFGN